MDGGGQGYGRNLDSTTPCILDGNADVGPGTVHPETTGPEIAAGLDIVPGQQPLRLG